MEIENLPKKPIDKGFFLDMANSFIKESTELAMKRVFVSDADVIDYKELTTKKINIGEWVFVHVAYYRNYVSVNWYKDGKYHREDGPATQLYSLKDGKLQLCFFNYYYDGNYCMKLVMNNFEEKTASIGVELDRRCINKNIYYIKVLTKNDIQTYWYWVEPVS